LIHIEADMLLYDTVFKFLCIALDIGLWFIALAETIFKALSY